MPVGYAHHLTGEDRPEGIVAVAKMSAHKEYNNDNAIAIIANNEPHKTMDLPLINIKIYGNEYSCLCDSGSSGNVINEALYLSIKQQNPKILTLSTCGLFCSTAIGSKKQLIRGQALLNVEINHKFYELIFMVVPKLTVQIIIGCEAFLQYRAILDFNFKHLTLVNDKEINIIHFLTQYEDQSGELQVDGENLAQESLFVEMLSFNGQNLARVGPLRNEFKDELNNGCIVEGYCANCIDVFNAATEIDEQINLAIMSLSVADDLKEDVIEMTLRDRARAAQNITEAQRDSLFQILKKNKEVFSERLGLCNSYVHKFKVIDDSPYFHKARPIPAMLVPKVNEVVNQMLQDKVIKVSNSSYINPLCIVMKADNSVRITLDARRLNERTVPDTFNNRNLNQTLHNIDDSRLYRSYGK